MLPPTPIELLQYGALYVTVGLIIHGILATINGVIQHREDIITQQWREKNKC